MELDSSTKELKLTEEDISFPIIDSLIDSSGTYILFITYEQKCSLSRTVAGGEWFDIQISAIKYKEKKDFPGLVGIYKNVFMVQI